MSGTGETMEVQLQRAINEKGAALIELADTLIILAAQIEVLADKARAAAQPATPAG